MNTPSTNRQPGTEALSLLRAAARRQQIAHMLLMIDDAFSVWRGDRTDLQSLDNAITLAQNAVGLSGGDDGDFAATVNELCQAATACQARPWAVLENNANVEDVSRALDDRRNHALEAFRAAANAAISEIALATHGGAREGSGRKQVLPDAVRTITFQIPLDLLKRVDDVAGRGGRAALIRGAVAEWLEQHEPKLQHHAHQGDNR